MRTIVISADVRRSPSACTRPMRPAPMIPTRSGVWPLVEKRAEEAARNVERDARARDAFANDNIFTVRGIFASAVWLVLVFWCFGVLVDRTCLKIGSRVSTSLWRIVHREVWVPWYQHA